TNDWWTGEVMMSFTPKANADDADVSGKLSLASLAPRSAAYCGGPQAWTAWDAARIFANGNYVYLTVPVYTYDNTTSARSAKVIVAAIDATDPSAPALAGTGQIQLVSRADWYGYYGFWDGYDYYNYYGGIYGSVVGSGQGAVQVGAKVA